VATTDAGEEPTNTPLGRFLADARRDRSLSQVQVVEVTSLSQAQLSRIERGQSMPTVEQARELADLYKLNTDDRRDVVKAAKDHEAGRSDSRLVIQRGNILSLQQRFRRLEERATVIRSFSPTMVAGELQTSAYVAAVFGDSEDAAVVKDRLQRAVDAPRNRGRLYTAILTEGSLRWALRSASVMADQLDHLADASELPNVRLGLIGSRTFINIAPGPAFYLYDDHTVVLAGIGGFALLNSVGDLTEYRSSFEQLESIATFGDQTTARLREVASEYREVSRAGRR
jgi:transcriptional regulator with XRE-family HTH domain